MTRQVQGLQERDYLGQGSPRSYEDDEGPASGVGAAVPEPEGALLELDEGLDAGAELVVYSVKFKAGTSSAVSVRRARA